VGACRSILVVSVHDPTVQHAEIVYLSDFS